MIFAIVRGFVKLDKIHGVLEIFEGSRPQSFSLIGEISNYCDRDHLFPLKTNISLLFMTSLFYTVHPSYPARATN
jgi:hypothetical protein